MFAIKNRKQIPSNHILIDIFAKCDRITRHSGYSSLGTLQPNILHGSYVTKEKNCR